MNRKSGAGGLGKYIDSTLIVLIGRKRGKNETVSPRVRIYFEACRVNIYYWFPGENKQPKALSFVLVFSKDVTLSSTRSSKEAEATLCLRNAMDSDLNPFIRFHIMRITFPRAIAFGSNGMHVCMVNTFS